MLYGRNCTTSNVMRLGLQPRTCRWGVVVPHSQESLCSFFGLVKVFIRKKLEILFPFYKTCFYCFKKNVVFFFKVSSHCKKLKYIPIENILQYIFQLKIYYNIYSWQNTQYRIFVPQRILWSCYNNLWWNKYMFTQFLCQKHFAILSWFHVHVCPLYIENWISMSWIMFSDQPLKE
jgi:hypothetical protein